MAAPSRIIVSRKTAQICVKNSGIIVPLSSVFWYTFCQTMGITRYAYAVKR